MRMSAEIGGDLRITTAGRVVYFLLCSTVIWTTIAYGTVHQPIIALFYITAVVILVLWCADSLVSGSFRFSGNLLQAVIIATSLYGLIQIIPFGWYSKAGVEAIPRTISVAPYWTLVVSFHLIALLVVLSAWLSALNSVRRIRVLVSLIIVFGFLYAFFAILQSFLSPERIYGIYYSRFAVPFGSFVNRHAFAAFIEMALFLPLGMLFAGSVERDKRLIFATATGLMGVALILSGSRGGFVSLLAGVIFLVIMTAKKRRRGGFIFRAAMAAALVGVIVAGSLLVGGETSLSRFAETAASGDVSTNRFQIWSVTVSVIGEHFPLGAGLGAFGVAYTKFDPRNGFERVEQAHNDYLEVLADAGVVGAAIGVLFLYLLFREGLAAVKGENIYRRGVALGAFAGCFAVLVHSFFDFVLHIPAITVMFLTLIALLVSANRSYDDEIENPIRGRP